MKTSEAIALHPLKEIATKGFGQEAIRNYGTGESKILLRWNPTLAKHGLFSMSFEGKEMLIDAEELRSVTRVF